MICVKQTHTKLIGFKNIVGWGADGKAIIAILGHRNATQRTQIREAHIAESLPRGSHQTP